MNSLWKCPRCGKEWDITSRHYQRLLEMQQLVELGLSNYNDNIILLCWSCNYREEFEFKYDYDPSMSKLEMLKRLQPKEFVELKEIKPKED